jgi:SEC-C motif
MGYLLVGAVFVILVVLGLFVLSAAMVLVGRVLGLLFPVTTFQGALITTLVALGAILAFLLGYVGRIGDDVAHALAYLQEEDEADEEDDEDEADEDEADEEYPPLRLAPDWREGKPVSRNAPCPCGSGKKYKRCCLGREA